MPFQISSSIQSISRYFMPVSRRDVSIEVGVSDVTVGHYLECLADMGLVQKAAE
ncbi:MAG TPA: hypothetical protein GX716_00700 [Firmicutes bacterium]|nr:hypothetical protein [Candidatus Fermentithermobacillaceae bacterium]